MSATFKETLGNMRGAAAEAHRQLTIAVNGPQADPEVKFFKTLTAEEVASLRSSFGREQVDAYLRSMQEKEAG